MAWHEDTRLGGRLLTAANCEHGMCAVAKYHITHATAHCRYSDEMSPLDVTDGRDVLRKQKIADHVAARLRTGVHLEEGRRSKVDR